MVEHHDTVAPELSVLLLVFFSLLVVALVAADALQRRSCWPPAAASVLLVGAAAGDPTQVVGVGIGLARRGWDWQLDDRRVSRVLERW